MSKKYEIFHPGDGAFAPEMVKDLHTVDFFLVDENPATAEKSRTDYVTVMKRLGYFWNPFERPEEDCAQHP